MDEARAVEALRAILARPEFQPAADLDPWQLFWAAIWVLLETFLEWLLAPVREVARGRGTWIEVAVTLVAVAAIVAGIVFVVRVVRLHMVREASLGGRAAAARRQRSDGLWREAHALAEAGRFAEAARALYLSALYALEEHDVLAVHEALTNREHAARLVHLRPGAGRLFADVVGRYDRLRYGNYPLDASTFAELSERVRRARALAGGAEAPAP